MPEISHIRTFWVASLQLGMARIGSFWTSLVLLDTAAVVLLVMGKRRFGLGLAAVNKTLDVSANAYASRVLAIAGFDVALPIQAAFFGFVVASTFLLWPARD